MLLPKRRLVVLSLLFLVPGPAPADIVERIVAKVNGDIITQTEVEGRQLMAVQSARIDPDKIGAFLRENNARILQDAIDELLLVQRAAELNMRLRPEYIKEVIDGIKKENNIGSDEQLQEQLKHEGMTLDDLKRNIERSIMRRQVLSRELEPKLAVTDAEARADYEARKSEYVKPPAVNLQEILVGSLSRAREVVTRARAGEDFSALAKMYSAAPTGAAGGELGWLARGDLNPQLEAIAFALTPGGISDPISSGEAFRVLKVLEKRDGSTVPFEDVKAQIKQRLGQDRSNKEYDAYMEGLRKKAIIDVKVREVSLELKSPGAAAPSLATTSKVAPADPEAELVTSPQAAPERVAPGEALPDPDEKQKETNPPSPRPPS